MGRPIVVDTDGGVDDAVALWWALTDPAVDVLGITIVWGNVDLDVAADAVLRVLHACGRPEVPVALGEARPIGPAPDLRPAVPIAIGGSYAPWSNIVTGICRPTTLPSASRSIASTDVGPRPIMPNVR